MKTSTYSQKYKPTIYASIHDDLNGSPIATVSAAQPMLVASASKRRVPDCISPSKGATNYQPSVVYSQKVGGANNFTSSFERYTSPVKVVSPSFNQQSSGYKQSSYLSYLCQQEHERPIRFNDSEVGKVRTPQGASVKIKSPYKPSFGVSPHDQDDLGQMDESEGYLDDEDFEDYGEEGDEEQENVREDSGDHVYLHSESGSRNDGYGYPGTQLYQKSLSQQVKEQSASTNMKMYGSVTSATYHKDERKPVKPVLTNDHQFKNMGLRKVSHNQSTTHLEKSSSSSSHLTPSSSSMSQKQPTYKQTNSVNKSTIYKSSLHQNIRDESHGLSTTGESQKDTLRHSKTFYNPGTAANQHLRKQSSTVLSSTITNREKARISDLAKPQDGLYAKMQANGQVKAMTGDHTLNHSIQNASGNPQSKAFSYGPTSHITSANRSLYMNDPSSSTGVPSLMHAQKASKGITNGASGKKKKRKKTVSKKPITSAAYTLAGSQQIKISTPSHIQKCNVFQTTCDTKQQQNEYGSSTCVINKAPVNNENTQYDLATSTTPVVPSQPPQRSSSSNTKIQVQYQQQQTQQLKKRTQPTKTASFANPQPAHTSHALSSIVNQASFAQSVLASRTQSVPQATPTSNSTPKKKQWTLTDSEKATYGDRVPKGYEKLDLLGKGGCAIVWLGRNQKTNDLVAIKQFPKSQKTIDSTARVEVQIGRTLFPRDHPIDHKKYPGIKSIARLIEDIEEVKDFWVIYEVGSQCLSKHLYDVKGEFYKGERIYHVAHQPFFQCLKQNTMLLKQLIKKLAETFQILSDLKIVHADIKPDNILVSFDGRSIQDIKLIDFGSAFSFENPSNIQASTPEYLSPEVLEYLDNRAQNTQANGTNSTNLCKRLQPWSYDVWSLGAILLEILTGFPLWLSLKGRVTTSQGKSIIGTGIFGVQGREGKKILQKQQTILKSIPTMLKKYECHGLDKDEEFMDLLYGMLEFNPIRRISPSEILEHPYLRNI